MSIEEVYTNKTSIAHRKKYAQYFTPEPIAKLMVDWLFENQNVKNVLEPAFGLGIFSRIMLNLKKSISIRSFDIDRTIYSSAKQYFANIPNVELILDDYLENDWNSKYDSIICNPPYFKFHDYENKKSLDLIKAKLNINLSGFTNIYTLFLLKSIYQLAEKGRAVYIIPSEFLNSNYGKHIKEYLIKSNALRHIFIFDFKGQVFNDAITTSSILFLSKDNCDKDIHFSLIKNIADLEKIKNVINNYPNISGDITIRQDEIDCQIKWRNYYQERESIKYKNLVPFNRFAKVVRGIATGANEYFTFNLKKADKYNINPKYLLPCITKSKDVKIPFFTEQHYNTLKDSNSNIYLFNALAGEMDLNVKKYIEIGEENHIHEKYLTSKHTPWYSLENRSPSPIWVGVFNRTGLKFIRNEAQISNLTTFHCIYPINDLFYDVHIDLLFAYLLTDVANDIFSDNRREYGNGLKKFEPNDLNNALVMDLTTLTEEISNKIIKLYHSYRQSVIINNENREFLKEINLIFIETFSS